MRFACLALMIVAAAVPAYAQQKIVNVEERPTPWIVNGCTIAPRTSCPGVDLRFADLANADLTGADLSGAKLSRADMRHANLSGANLNGADLDGADLSIAFLNGAQLTGASLRGSNLAFARAGHATFDRVDFTAATLEKALLKGASFKEAKLIHADLLEALLLAVDRDDTDRLALALAIDGEIQFFQGLGQHDGHHCLADGHGADADAWVMAPFGDDLRLGAELVDGLARNEDR